MKNYLYVVWFRDSSRPPDDQDYEWVACMLIAAGSEALAQTWGDHLSALYCQRHPELQLLRSHTEPEPSERSGYVPSISYGELAGDDVIGW
jgi:hypothetical protein